MTKDFVGTGARGDRSDRHQAGAAGARSHRNGDDAGPRPRRRHPEAAAEMGISVAVDDFGTGYSNLSYLIDFSFQQAEDRPLLRQPHRHRLQLRRRRLDHRRPVAGARRAHHRRRRRDREPGDAAEGGRLRGGAGLPVRPAGAAEDRERRHRCPPIRAAGRGQRSLAKPFARRKQLNALSRAISVLREQGGKITLVGKAPVGHEIERAAVSAPLPRPRSACADFRLGRPARGRAGS